MSIAEAPPRKLTADEFLRMSGNEFYELVDGELVEVHMGAKSGWLAGRVFRKMANYAEEHNLGEAFPADVGIAVWPNPHKVRKPDCFFVRRERETDEVPDGWYRVVPDLVVEVISPGDEVEEFAKKLADYREANIPLLWVVYPGLQRTDIYRDGVSVEEIGIDGTLEAPDILPGFTLTMRDLFARLAAN